MMCVPFVVLVPFSNAALAAPPPNARITKESTSRVMNVIEKTFGLRREYSGPIRLTIMPRMKNMPAAMNDGAMIVQQIL